MTKEEAKKLLPVIQAYTEGKEIQCAYLKGEQLVWEDCENPTWLDMYLYRVKPEKPEDKYRPFKSKEECWEEMKKHESFGWIKDVNSIYNITAMNNENIYLSDWEDEINTYSFTNALFLFTFMDDSKFGVKEE